MRALSSAEKRNKILKITNEKKAEIGKMFVSRIWADRDHTQYSACWERKIYSLQNENLDLEELVRVAGREQNIDTM